MWHNQYYSGKLLWNKISFASLYGIITQHFYGVIYTRTHEKRVGALFRNFIHRLYLTGKKRYLGRPLWYNSDRKQHNLRWGMLRGRPTKKLNSLFIQNVKNSKWPPPGIVRLASRFIMQPVGQCVDIGIHTHIETMPYYFKMGVVRVFAYVLLNHALNFGNFCLCRG